MADSTLKSTLILPIYLVNSGLLDMTERCLMSMNQQKPDEVLIIDDGSPLAIGSTNYFANLVAAKVHRLDPNQGYTKAVNEGLKSAKGDVIIIGNNDLLFPENWLEGLFKPLQQGYDIATVQVVDETQDAVDSEEITEGDKFGSLFAITRKVYRKLGLLDESLGRGYFTDLDYHKRADDAGFKVGKYWGTQITHFPKSTHKETDPQDEEYLYSMEKFKQKWGSVW